MKQKLRQPICTVAGHVDHGKTSILDALRETSVQEGEAGGITQKISFTSYPAEQLKIACPLIEKSGIKLNIPGFLLIDTPGHAAFTNLRKRGGSLADLAVLVIDINEGIKPQTSEVIQILKLNKTPFIIALNKIDKISGWEKIEGSLKNSVENQRERVGQDFLEKYYTLQGALQSYGLDTDLFYNITDFTKKIA
ncbi:MAG: GTP-binding protein, partial [archaeon]|nr:GTP-binding protein [archaeon]